MAFDWGSGIAAIGSAAAGLLGNSSAKKSANKATKKQIKYLEEAEARARQERAQGRAASLALIKPYLDDSQTRAYFTGQMTSRPDMLTGTQLRGLEAATRDATRTVASSGLRGTGRGGLAVINQAQQQYRDMAEDENRARSDNAAGILHRQSDDAIKTGVNIETGQSTANASDIMNNAGNIGASLSQIGLNNAGATTANAELIGGTLGALATIAAQDRKYGKEYPTLKVG